MDFLTIEFNVFEECILGGQVVKGLLFHADERSELDILKVMDRFSFSFFFFCYLFTSSKVVTFNFKKLSNRDSIKT